MFRIYVKKKCFKCSISCSNCNGSGEFIQSIQNIFFCQIISIKCNTCDGKGYNYNNNNTDCERCKGEHEYKVESINELIIPKGIENGYKIVLDGYGEQCKRTNDLPGDLIFLVNVNNDPIFTRQNRNLIYKLDINYIDSIIGKYIQIPYFNESININTNIFGIIDPRISYVIYKKGLGIDSCIGDMIIQFNVIFPSKEDQDEIIKQFKQLH